MKGTSIVGIFIIFIGTVLILSIIGLAVSWIWKKINISIQRRNSVFEIEKEAHEKMKKEIKEDE